MSRIRIDESQLVAGENTITLTITGESGASRTLILTVERVAGQRAITQVYIQHALLDYGEVLTFYYNYISYIHKLYIMYPHFFGTYTAVYLHVNCSAVPDGDDVVVSCATVGNSERISSILYSINGGTARRGEGLMNCPYA